MEPTNTPIPDDGSPSLEPPLSQQLVRLGALSNSVLLIALAHGQLREAYRLGRPELTLDEMLTLETIMEQWLKRIDARLVTLQARLERGH